MTCKPYEDAIVDLGRNRDVDDRVAAAVESHAARCPSCAARLARERALTAGMRALAGSAQHEGAPEALAGSLLETFASRHQAGGEPLTGWRSWIAAAAAVVILVTGLAAAWRALEPPVDRGAAPPVSADVQEFVPWPGAAALPAFESGQLVRTELPVTVLPLLGLVPASAPAGNKVTADVLVGQDGLARAVRLAR
jgi:anti-sigma factor RsiW